MKRKTPPLVEQVNQKQYFKIFKIKNYKRINLLLVRSYKS